VRGLLPLLLAGAVLLGACAAEEGNAVSDDGRPAAAPTTPDDAASGIVRADNDLRIEVDLADGTSPQAWTLTCVGFVEGSHPRAEEACAHLDGMTDPFAPLPADVMCTEQYGGPQTAHITGRWRGEPVDLDLSRVDGCRISQWDAFGPVLPVPVGDVAPLG
jgi:hypothetical protein